MKGQCDPRTGAPFTVEQQHIFDGYDPSDALHHSKIKTLQASELPNNKSSVFECTSEELKPMVLARGGSITSHAGRPVHVDDLKEVAAGFLNLEMEVPSRKVYFDCNPQTNGIFSKINTKHGANIGQIIGQVARQSRIAGIRFARFLEGCSEALS